MKNTQNINFHNREDMVKALTNSLSALIPQFGTDQSLILPCTTGSHYSQTGAGLEKTLRPFWGVLPALMGGEDSPIITEYVQKSVRGILDSLESENPLYLGAFCDCDQKFVEMCVVGLSLIMTPSVFWTGLTKEEQQKIQQWLSEVNNYDYPPNNWRFFRIFCNTGLMTCGEGGSQAQTEEDFQLIDSCYKGDGWYSDGLQEQYDYYISFAMHFYGLVYATLREKEDPVRAKKFKERASLFAKDFLLWFAPTGESAPFGRSLTYRFAQSSFWAAVAFARLDKDVPWLDMGTIKGLLLRNLRWWYSKPIFDEGGLLSIGYAYPNLIMAENYNAPGSPYWAFKSFLVLALKEDHPFWQAKEKPFPANAPEISLQKHPRFLVCRTQTDDVRVLNAGQYAGFEPRHTNQKYAKLSYSTLFGFSVPTGNRKLSEQGGDNALMIKTESGLWLHRGRTHNHNFVSEVLSSDWQVREGLLTRSILTWIADWEIRLHLIQSNKPIEFAEGGSACPMDVRSQTLRSSLGEYRTEGQGLWSEIHPFNTKLQGTQLEETCLVIGLDTNSNLLHPRTALPMILRKQSAGVCLWGTMSAAGRENQQLKRIEPKLTIEGEKAIIMVQDVTREFPAKWLEIS